MTPNDATQTFPGNLTKDRPAQLGAAVPSGWSIRVLMLLTKGEQVSDERARAAGLRALRHAGGMVGFARKGFVETVAGAVEHGSAEAPARSGDDFR